MGGHGGSSGYIKIKSASKEIEDASEKLHSGEITLGEYAKAKTAIVAKYGLSKEETKLAIGMKNMTSEAAKKQAYKEQQGSEASKSTPKSSSIDSATMKDIETTLKNMQEMKQDGSITSKEFDDMVGSLATNYGISSKDMNKIKNDVLSDSIKGATGDVSSLPGQNGNKWPPDAGNNHLSYEGGGGLGIWNQLGGGAKNGGVSSKTAKEMNDAVKSFTFTGYGGIRHAQQTGDTTSTYGKKAVTLEKFISKAISTGNGWNGGATYRGVGDLSDSALKNLQSLKPGDSVDPNLGGSASWSTKRSVSEHFGSSYNHVTFVHLGSSQKGVSVAKISSVGTHEQEVLVSKDAKFKVQAIVPGKVGAHSQTYIYVEDA